MKNETRSSFDKCKEETFFDSQPWFESECESDFMSVNGGWWVYIGMIPQHEVMQPQTPPPVPLHRGIASRNKQNRHTHTESYRTTFSSNVQLIMHSVLLFLIKCKWGMEVMSISSKMDVVVWKRYR